VLARLDLALRPDAVVTPAPGATVALGPTRGVQATPSGQPGCVELDANAVNEITLRPTGAATVRLGGDGPVRMFLRDETRRVDGEAVAGLLDPAADQMLSMAGGVGSVVITVPRGPGTLLCGVG
jgi:hypothetical protein